MWRQYVRKLAVRVAVTGAVCVALLIAGLAWLVYQPGGGRQSAYEVFVDAAARDPARGAVYARSYEALMEVTDADPQHYVVHKMAAALATVTGHPVAAHEQENRAEQHVPSWIRQVVHQS